jgi:hypothetical protein
MGRSIQILKDRGHLEDECHVKNRAYFQDDGKWRPISGLEAILSVVLRRPGPRLTIWRGPPPAG